MNKQKLFTAEEMANIGWVEPRPDLFVIVAFSPNWGWRLRPGSYPTMEAAQIAADKLNKIWVRRIIFKIPGDSPSE